ncbi:unnamed protein product [Polarella glacialis]|uniref:Uncharacterized protein n=1 Tax=Polarella glacialis TaxID=89957 RepID=A0A813FBA9_POLGL|nr:unnamed protein product [Polarella glacialis]
MRKMKAASDLFQENQALRTLAERLQRELAAVEEEGKRYFDELLAAEALSVSEGADRGDVSDSGSQSTCDMQEAEELTSRRLLAAAEANSRRLEGLLQQRRGDSSQVRGVSDSRH